jgi:hypothetical protein
MGHERGQALPKTRRWADIVGAMSSLHGQEGGVASIVRQTTENVRSRFRFIERDSGVLAAFRFLVALAAASRSQAPDQVLSNLGINLPAAPTPLSLVQTLKDWVAGHLDRAEYGSLATWAASDAIVAWYSQQAKQGQLFAAHEDPYDVWRAAADGSGFCELSRLFFARFTERYLNYFLEREASAAIPSIEKREQFQRDLQQHVDRVSHHAFEMARITQSFAAGWFNKHAAQGVPAEREIRGFLRVAFGKLDEELRREGSPT